MRVVSQRRNFSFDFDRTVFWTQDNIVYAHIGVSMSDKVIGKYESPDRAAEVFDDMHTNYSTAEGSVYLMPEE